MRRLDGTVNFYRPWIVYKEGFGNLEREFWLGLSDVFSLSNFSDCLALFFGRSFLYYEVSKFIGTITGNNNNYYYC